MSEPDEPLPPLPTKIRFEARYREVPRGRHDIGLLLFVAAIVFIFATGLQGISAITQFLDLTKRSLELRARKQPSPTPTPEVEIRFEPRGVQ